MRTSSPSPASFMATGTDAGPAPDHGEQRGDGKVERDRDPLVEDLALAVDQLLQRHLGEDALDLFLDREEDLADGAELGPQVDRAGEGEDLVDPRGLPLQGHQ